MSTVYSQRPYGKGPLGGATLGIGGPPPRDVVVLLGVLFVTFTLKFFASTAIVPALLRLSPAVWENAFLWQLLTYGFVGAGGPSLWILLEFLILYWFARDIFLRLGRTRFWSLLAWGVLGGSTVAVLVQLLAGGALATQAAAPFELMQGQRILLVVLIAAFATLYADAVIYLFFVLPIKARWFIWIGILFAFMGFLSTKDAAGFAGICAGTGSAYWYLARPTRRRGGMKGWWQRVQDERFQRKVDRMAKRRGLRVVRGGGGGSERDDERPPTIH